MKAYRNVAGDVREISVDVGLDGQPILPPDTTVDARPEAQPGHYVTVVGKAWVQIETPVLFETFETKQNRKVQDIGKYRNWLTEQPVEISGVKFDADEQARSRLTQAMVMQGTLAYLPPVWVTFDNGLHPIAGVEDLTAIVAGVQTAFAERFYECSALRQAAVDAADQGALDAVVIPVYGNRF